jgi:hypothetical protein
MEHRNALIVDMELTEASGHAERDAALGMLARLPARAGRRTVAGDKGYDGAAFVAQVRNLGFTPHFAPNTTRQHNTIDGRTTRHAGHQVSQRIRKRIEEPFGWMKTIAGGRKLRYIGKRRNRAWFLLTGAIYNWRSSGLTDIHQVGRSPGKDVQNGDRGAEEASPAQVVHARVQGRGRRVGTPTRSDRGQCGPGPRPDRDGGARVGQAV